MNSVKLTFIIGCLFAFSCGQSQSSETASHIVGGRCEGCEAALEYGDSELSNTVTLPDFEESNDKLEISGIIYKKDGKTPAKNVILYVYQTDAKGIYPKKGDETGWGKRHGNIRGWLKTDASGKYTIRTLRPSSYPNSTIMAHIHAVVKEPELNPYYIDDFLFDDDPHLPNRQRNNPSAKAGSGVLKLTKSGNVSKATRDIILGKNIQDYPTN